MELEGLGTVQEPPLTVRPFAIASRVLLHLTVVLVGVTPPVSPGNVVLTYPTRSAPPPTAIGSSEEEMLKKRKCGIKAYSIM